MLTGTSLLHRSAARCVPLAMHSNVPLISVYQMIYPLPSPTCPNLCRRALQPTFGLAHALHAPQCTLAVPAPPQHIPTHDDVLSRIITASILHFKEHTTYCLRLSTATGA